MTAKIINLFSTPNKDVESNDVGNSLQSNSNIITSSFFLKNPVYCAKHYPQELLKLKKIARNYIMNKDIKMLEWNKKMANYFFRLYKKVLEVAREV